ncbi:TetR/AcrR family transcriptional regulator [Paenibacillus sp. FJAT-27812]|uniref:TetR/AcrR family transcriptional regulator n=1 Tax=Paenibacillus sp. FJAT-27812 TaxID=1684143 RepID=UPI0006A7E102|nr:TetR/AcrR family transcriptional regulator [Paenibacillus sp. FJAT-27812]
MGRTKAFEESAVLHKAMQLFWEQGYEKTSLNDLVEHMGIHRRSMYDTFGDKHSLYLKSLDRYGHMVGSQLEAGAKGAQTASQAIRFIFDFIIEGGEDRPLGCMFVNSAIELAARDEEVDAKAAKGFDHTEQLLVDIIRRGQQTGEFTADHDAQALAEHLHNTLLGLRVLVRTTVGKEKLHRIANFALAAMEK